MIETGLRKTEIFEERVLFFRFQTGKFFLKTGADRNDARAFGFGHFDHIAAHSG